MARFVIFVYQIEELERCRARYPEHEFCFVSQQPLEEETLVARSDDHGSLRDELSKRHAQSPFAGVLNTKEGFVLVANALSNDLGLPTAIENPQLARDKLRMHEALAAHVNRPRCELLEGDAAHPDLAYPCVLKPRFGFDSLGVSRVDDPRELARHLPELRRLVARLPFDAFTTREILIEEFIAGSEHSVETLKWQGEVRLQIVSDKWPMPAKNLVETGEVMPSQLSEEDQCKVKQATRQALHALGIQNGWSHSEVKLDDGEPVLIECAARMGGGYFEALVEAVHGIDRLGSLMDLHCGEWSEAKLTSSRVAIARRLLQRRSAWVWDIRGADPGEGVDDVFRILDRMELGRFGRLVVPPPRGHRQNLMEWIVTAASLPEALERVENIEAAFDIRDIPIPEGIALLFDR